MTTHASELPLIDVQVLALREWAQATEAELESEDTYDCSEHGLVTGTYCERCGPSPEPEDMTEAQLSRATYHAELMSQGER